MTSQPSPTDSSRSWRSKSDRTRWGVVAVVVLLLIGAGFIVAGLGGNRGSDPIHGALPVAGNAAPVVAQARPAVAAHSVPVSLRIPALGVSSSLSQLGLNADKSPQ